MNFQSSSNSCPQINYFKLMNSPGKTNTTTTAAGAAAYSPDRTVFGAPPRSSSSLRNTLDILNQASILAQTQTTALEQVNGLVSSTSNPKDDLETQLLLLQHLHSQQQQQQQEQQQPQQPPTIRNPKETSMQLHLRQQQHQQHEPCLKGPDVRSSLVNAKEPKLQQLQKLSRNTNISRQLLREQLKKAGIGSAGTAPKPNTISNSYEVNLETKRPDDVERILNLMMLQQQQQQQQQQKQQNEAAVSALLENLQNQLSPRNRIINEALMHLNATSSLPNVNTNGIDAISSRALSSERMTLQLLQGYAQQQRQQQQQQQLVSNRDQVSGLLLLDAIKKEQILLNELANPNRLNHIQMQNNRTFAAPNAALGDHFKVEEDRKPYVPSNPLSVSYQEHIKIGIERRAEHINGDASDSTKEVDTKNDTDSDVPMKKCSRPNTEGNSEEEIAEDEDSSHGEEHEDDEDMSKVDDPMNGTEVNDQDPKNSNSNSNETFPYKLYRMLVEVEDEGEGHIASFYEHGCSFAIHKPKLFTSGILRKYFTTGRISSFQRQLNLYGFRRITDGPDKGGYWHENFLKGCPALCRKIKRKKTIVSSTTTNAHDMNVIRNMLFQQPSTTAVRDGNHNLASALSLLGLQSKLSHEQLRNNSNYF